MRLVNADDFISRFDHVPLVQEAIKKAMDCMPTIEEREKGKWTTEQVAELLANMFGEECACNFNGIDEWLPSACKYSETTCPNPKEKHGCWMQFLIQGGADMRGNDNG